MEDKKDYNVLCHLFRVHVRDSIKSRKIIFACQAQERLSQS